MVIKNRRVALNQNIFLTGGTGFVGRNLIPRILNQDLNAKVNVLVREKSKIDGKRRFIKILRSLRGEIDTEQAISRIKVIEGDIALKNFGLPDNEYSELASRVTHIIHSAASVEFQLPLQKARETNCIGTARVMELARHSRKTGKLKRVAYVSTAYVCGNRTGTIFESELKCGQEFSNTYEQSKYEAEQLASDLKSELPVTVFRPSIIVGDSKTGRTSAFNVLYYPLKLIYLGMLRFIPGSSQTPLDVVPVDFVCDAICHILLKTNKGVGETYHLTAGADRINTTGEIVEMAVDFFNHSTSSSRIYYPKFIPLELYRAIRWIFYSRAKYLLEKIEQYIPYLYCKKIFDNSNTLHVLRDSSITVPHFRHYYCRLLQYCIEVDWGKQLQPIL
jgi:thioester reductase-like protein